jgi:hypothetical protein
MVGPLRLCAGVRELTAKLGRIWLREGIESLPKDKKKARQAGLFSTV